MTSTAVPLHEALTEEFRRRLLDARASLFRTIDLTDEELAALGEPEPGAPLEHAATQAAAALLARLEGQEKHGLDEIADALFRLDGGSYGRCQTCQRAIPLLRLRALPTARRCLPCQMQSEARL